LEDLIGIDTNILAYALDPTYPEHEQAKGAILSQEGWALNATVVHETYHTLVFRRRISPNDSKIKISSFLKNQRTTFLNLTKAVSLFALDLATKTDLGGRDSVIIGCYLQNRIPEIYSHDDDLLTLKRISLKGRQLRVTDPIR